MPEHNITDYVSLNNKKIKSIILKHDPDYNDAVKSIEIVKEFIKKTGAIIYGGTAIDYALRLVGDCIYPDEALDLPDLDFYSPDSVKDAYDLTELLYDAGFKDARCIVALYVKTMRVDIKNNHWVADISYVPEEIFRSLPTLEYDGMKIIHPDIQKIDQHTALSFPLTDPATGYDIFNRWEKDVVRYTILEKYYPIEIPNKSKLQLTPTIYKVIYINSIFSGFIAYSLLFIGLQMLIDIFMKWGSKSSSHKKIIDQFINKIIPGEFKYEKNFYFHTLENTIEIMHCDPDRLIRILRLTDVKRYSSYHSLRLPIITGKNGSIKIIIYNTKNKLLNITKINVGAVHYRTVGIQYLMQWCLTNIHLYRVGSPSNHADVEKQKLFQKYYNSLKIMIECSEYIFKTFYSWAGTNKKQIEKIDLLLGVSPFFPNITMYGENNKSETHIRLINMMDKDLYNQGKKDIKLNEAKIPYGYAPAKIDRPKPFDYSGKFFKKDGKLITDDN